MINQVLMLSEDEEAAVRKEIPFCWLTFHSLYDIIELYFLQGGRTNGIAITGILPHSSS